MWQTDPRPILAGAQLEESDRRALSEALEDLELKKQELADAGVILEAVKLGIRRRYQLSPSDSVDFKTGAIARARA